MTNVTPINQPKSNKDQLPDYVYDLLFAAKYALFSAPNLNDAAIEGLVSAIDTFEEHNQIDSDSSPRAS